MIWGTPILGIPLIVVCSRHRMGLQICPSDCYCSHFVAHMVTLFVSGAATPMDRHVRNWKTTGQQSSITTCWNVQPAFDSYMTKKLGDNIKLFTLCFLGQRLRLSTPFLEHLWRKHHWIQGAPFGSRQMNFRWARPTDLAWGLAAGLLAEGSGLPEVLQGGCAGKERLYKEPKGYG